MKNGKILIGVGIGTGCALLLVLAVIAATAGILNYRRRVSEFDRRMVELYAQQLSLEPAAGCPAGQVPPADAPGLFLPDIAGLAGPDAAGPDAPVGYGTTVSRLTVLVDASGAARIEGQDSVGAWRGTDLPRDVGPQPVTSQGGDWLLDELVIHIAMRTGAAAGFEYRIRDWSTGDLRDLNARLAQLAQVGRMSVVIAPKPDVPFGAVAGAIVAATERDFPIEFRPPPAKAEGPAPRNPALKNEILRRAAERPDAEGLSTLGVRVRADSRAPWSGVTAVLMACMEAKTWRVAFAAMRDGQEVTIGRPGGTGPAARPAVIRREIPLPLNSKDIFAPADLDKPVVGPDDHGKVEDPPLDGTGVRDTRPSGPPHASGGSRKRAVARFGGSAATEAAVEAALRWLARHQDPDGRWSTARWEGAAKSDEAATCLALLAFLGAGYTDRQGQFRDGVARAERWLVGRQAADGRIGPDAETQALAALALAEAWGMSRTDSLGLPAQKAVDALLALQEPYSGWPRGAPSLPVTAWSVLAFRSAKVAGLKVDGAAFQGTMALFGKLVSEKGEFAATAGGAAAPEMTARGLTGLVFMGVPYEGPKVRGGIRHLLTRTPAWGEGADLVYWHWGTLAAFQAGGRTDGWPQWNEALKKALVENQRKGGPLDGTAEDTDGSWDPAECGCRETGRVGAAALGALCLEVYYRYLPMYTK